MPVARWSLLSRNTALARSSHCLAVTAAGRVALYGGELKPRTPVDADDGQKGTIHVFDVTQSSVKSDATAATWQSAKAASAGTTPEPRVGATTAIWDDKLYLWGGRGGVDMAPIAGEQAGVWCTPLSDPTRAQWERLTAVNENEAPQPRSYHTMSALAGKLYIHAGCPASGRIGELHSFDLQSKTWKELASAPEPGRGGTVLALSKLNNKDVFLRYAGFAGFELGADHTLDIYDIAQNTWRTVTPSPDATHGHPGPRSVHGFVGFSNPKIPSAIALMYHGERDPSSLGHAGAGKFWDDVWLLHEVKEDEGNGGLQWESVRVEGEGPEARGWFPPGSFTDESGSTKVVLQGGLLGSNERSDELWLLEVD